MLDFFKRLLPNFEKRQLINQLETLTQNYTTTVLPMVTGVKTTYSEKNITSKCKLIVQLEKDTKRLQRRAPHASFGPFYNTIETVVNEAVGKINLLERHVNQLFGNQIATSGLTFKQVEVLRLIDLFSFHVKYTSRLLHLAVYDDMGSAAKGINPPLLPGEVSWLNDNYQTYLAISEIMLYNDRDFNDAVTKTSELVVTENEDGDISNLGVNSDPFKLGFMPGVFNAIFFIRGLKLEYDTKKYEANKTRLQSIQLQLQLLKEQAASNTEGEDEVLKRQINYYINRVKDLESAIRKYEEDAGL